MGDGHSDTAVSPEILNQRLIEDLYDDLDQLDAGPVPVMGSGWWPSSFYPVVPYGGR